MPLDRLPIGAKLFILPAIAACGLSATLWTSHVGCRQMAEAAHQILAESEASAAEMMALSQRLEHAVALVRAAPSAIDLDKLRAEQAEYGAILDALAVQLPEAAEPAGDVPSDLERLRAAGTQVFDYAGQFAQLQATEAVQGPFREAVERIDLRVADFRARAKAASEALLAGLVDARREMHRTLVATGLLALLAGVGLSLWIARNLTRRMYRLEARMSGIAAGEMGDAIGGTKARDELGKMARALQVVRDGLIEKEALVRRDRDRQAAERAAAARADEAAREAEVDAARRRAETEREQAESAAREAAERDAMRAEAERERQAILDTQGLVLSELGTGLRKLADGRLDAEIGTAFKPEHEPIRHDFNDAVRKLRDIVVLIAESGEEIGKASTQVASAATQLAFRTEKNAASLEEASATLGELTGSVATTSDDAATAHGIADTALGQSEKGIRVVAETVAAMERIQDASSKISTIIEVIEGISFQTNLLALNAGVEAARAGESGRGFAVVASEVRALAHRSSDAAREISALIGEEHANVRQGVDLVRQTGDALASIARSVENMAHGITGISEAARLQSAGISEINNSVAEIERATQEYAAMFEETNAAAHLLSSHSEELERVISRFSLAADPVAVAAE